MTAPPARRIRSNSSTVEHPDEPDKLLPEDYLERHHPENDSYMKAVEHVQRQIMHQTTILRTKQVNIIKSVFAGDMYTQAAKKHNTTATTVSKLCRSEKGQRLLNLLQYHLNMIEGPNLAQRRALLWRVAQAAEEHKPDTAIKATEALNKMTFQAFEQARPADAPAPSVQIFINPELPAGALDG